MSSAAILAQIHALQAKVDALNEAIGHLNNASTSFSQFPPVLEEIGAGWKNSIIINGEPADKGKAVERAKEFQEFIEKIGLVGFEKNYPHQISGGMAQRVAIARALINDPEVLLLDEPMGALDSFTRAEIQDLLLNLKQKNNTTMILVTHDIDEAIYLSNRIVIMTPRPGRISEVLTIDETFPRNRGSEEFLKLRKKILERFNLARVKPNPEYFI